MHELQPLLGSETHLAREQPSVLLCVDAGVAELLHVLHLQDALHHLLGVELLQSLEMKMAEALVAPPRVVVAKRYRAVVLPQCGEHRADCFLASPWREADPADPRLQARCSRSPPLIHSCPAAQADDGVAQGRDVVHIGEQPVFAHLGNEDHRASTCNLHCCGIPKLDGASYSGVEV